MQPALFRSANSRQLVHRMLIATPKTVYVLDSQVVQPLTHSPGSSIAPPFPLLLYWKSNEHPARARAAVYGAVRFGRTSRLGLGPAQGAQPIFPNGLDPA